MHKILLKSQLGRESRYNTHYDNSLLFPVPRSHQRKKIDIVDEYNLPFYGADIWNAYEFSWLDAKGKPQIAELEIIYAYNSQFVIESKSLKLYLYSFSGTCFESEKDVLALLTRDLSATVQSDAIIKFKSNQNDLPSFRHPKGFCLDNLDVKIGKTKSPKAEMLQLAESEAIVKEQLYSNLLVSLCPMTSHPDWATLEIEYEGRKIDHASLLKYIVSFRNHNEFHEMCVERIFMDIMRTCSPKLLSVYARYTRRGGIDINPLRTNDKKFSIDNRRLVRQ